MVVAIYLLSVLIIGALSFAAGLNYQGHWGVYLLFTLVANTLLINGFRKGAIYFDTFIGIFLWLGFWLKFSVRVAFFSGEFHESIGDFDGSSAAFDSALNVSTCGIAAFLLASLLRRRFFKYPDSSITCTRSGLFQCYKAHRRLVVGAFLGLVFLVSAGNAWLGIYQRGMVTQTVLPYGMNGVFKWLLQFGMASISALIIRFEIELNREVSLIAIVPPLLEAFFSNVSLLSRGMILNSMGLAVGGIRTILAAKFKLSLLRVSIAALVFIVLFAASVLSVNYLRANAFVGDVTDDSTRAMSEARGMSTPLFLDRWVGIEGVMAVSSSKLLGWALWNEALAEKFQEGQLSLYDRTFIDSPYTSASTDKPKNHFVSLPGIVAFFYYPGSYIFLFVALFFLGLFAAANECFVYRFGGRNWVLCSLFAQVIAFRYVSFGYVPSQSYLLFGSLVLNVLFIYSADKMLIMHQSRRGLYA